MILPFIQDLHQFGTDWINFMRVHHMWFYIFIMFWVLYVGIGTGRYRISIFKTTLAAVLGTVLLIGLVPILLFLLIPMAVILSIVLVLVVFTLRRC